MPNGKPAIATAKLFGGRASRRPAATIRPAFRRAGAAAIVALSVISIGGILTRPAQAENEYISIRRASEQTTFTDSQIADGFFKIAFRAELQVGPRVDRIRKFDGPVRVFIDNRGTPARRGLMEAVIRDIGARVEHLDIAVVTTRQDSNFVVILVPKRDFQRTILSRYGRARARQIEQKLNPECLSGISKDAEFRIRRAEVILPADADEFRFYDCAYEEALQALGAINDDNSVSWTMFNDDVQMGFFDVYDQYLLNIIYDPRIRAGMDKETAGRLLPDIVASIRARLGTVASARDPSAILPISDNRPGGKEK